MISHTRKVLYAPPTDQHNAMFLKVVPLTRDVADHLVSVRQTHLSYLPQSRIGLLGRCRINACADTALLRTPFQGRDLVSLRRRLTSMGDQLINRRHTPSFRSFDSFSPRDPAWPSLNNDVAARRGRSHPSGYSNLHAALATHTGDGTAYCRAYFPRLTSARPINRARTSTGPTGLSQAESLAAKGGRPSATTPSRPQAAPVAHRQPMGESRVSFDLYARQRR